MKKRVLCLLSVCLFCAFAGLTYAQSGSSKNWDILGVSLGMPLEVATSALKPDLQPNQKPRLNKIAFAKGQFKSPELLLGAEIIGREAVVNLALDHNGKIIGVWRRTDFNIKGMTKPTFTAMYKSLIEKYGEPTYTDDSLKDSSITYYWSRNADSTSAPINSENRYKIANTMRYIINLSRGGYNDVDNWADFNNLETCLTFIVHKDQANPDLVPLMECGLVDSKGAVATHEYIMKLLADGDANITTKQKEQGNQVKPRL